MTRAWHFVGETLRDGSPIPPEGEWLGFTGLCVICESGLHASRTPFDALQYAPGGTLCLVEVDGIEFEQSDKLVCRRRKIIARMDATELLRYFARLQALSVIHLWACPPDVVLDFLATGDEAIRAAAWAAAREAARAAAWEAAWEAAWAAAWAAARAAAWEAAREAAKNEFNQLVYECFEDFL